MIRKISILLFSCLLTLLSSLFSSEKEEGYALLDKYIMTFKIMAEKGTGGRENLDKALESMMMDAKKAKTEGKIDQVFFNRYRRILMAAKLGIVEDPAGILGAIIEREINDFIEEVIGEVLDMSSKSSKIGPFANAIAQEIINLHLYLETKEKKEKLLKDFYQGFELKKGKKE